MFMSIPFSHLVPWQVADLLEDLEFVIEVVEYDHARMLLKDFQKRDLPARRLVDDPPPNITEHACVLDRLVLIRIPSRPTDLFVLQRVVVAPNIVVVRYGFTLEVHVYEDFVSESDESTRVKVTVDLWVFGES